MQPRRPSLVAIVVAVSVAAATPAAAQEIVVTGPLRGACPAIARTFTVPAPVETLYWISGGAVMEGGTPSAFGGVGGELTMGIHEFRAPPPADPSSETGSAKQHRRGPLEVRLGPWGQAALRSAGALVEGGATFHIGAVDDRLVRASSLAMFDVRGGGGYGAFALRSAPYATAAIAWGLRTVFDRHTVGLPCDPEPDPPLVADATAIRLVLSVRAATDFPATEIGIAIEVTPTAIFLPWRVAEKRER